jgi:hypothetical protein
MLREGARTKGISRIEDFFLRHNYTSKAAGAARRIGARGSGNFGWPTRIYDRSPTSIAAGTGTDGIHLPSLR